MHAEHPVNSKLGTALSVVAVLISGLALYQSWRATNISREQLTVMSRQVSPAFKFRTRFIPSQTFPLTIHVVCANQGAPITIKNASFGIDFPMQENGGAIQWLNVDSSCDYAGSVLGTNAEVEMDFRVSRSTVRRRGDRVPVGESPEFLNWMRKQGKVPPNEFEPFIYLILSSGDIVRHPSNGAGAADFFASYGGTDWQSKESLQKLWESLREAVLAEVRDSK